LYEYLYKKRKGKQQMSVCGEIENVKREISQVESLMTSWSDDPKLVDSAQAQVNELQRRLKMLEEI